MITQSGACANASSAAALVKRQGCVGQEQAGVDHRDIKPANLGVREGRSDRAKSCSTVAVAGRRHRGDCGHAPYLDPFLDARGRDELAAEKERCPAVTGLACGRICR
jgi:hypothetical protein